MLGDDYNSTRSQLDSIRARRSKFICINDNINEMTPELFSLLRDFFTSYYPRPSRFELPDGVVNRHLRLEDHLSEIFWRRASATAAFCFIALILVRISTSSSSNHLFPLRRLTTFGISLRHPRKKLQIAEPTRPTDERQSSRFLSVIAVVHTRRYLQ